MSEIIEIDWKDKLYAVWMFVKLRYSQWSFYYTYWIIELVLSFGWLAGMFFLSRFIGDPSLVQEYGGDYAAFVLLGMICNGLLTDVEEAPYARMHEAFRGSYQMYLLSPVGIWAYLLGSIIWIFIFYATVEFLFKIVLVNLFFGVTISFPADPIAFLVIFLLSVLSAVGLSFISCSTFSLLNAKGYNNPLRFFMYSIQGTIAGVFFPIAVMPLWLQTIAMMLPHFYTYRSLRLVLLANATLSDPTVLSDIYTLALFSAFLLITGIILFKLGLKKAKKDGNLTRWV